MYLFGVVSIGISQAIVVYGLGWPLLAALDRARGSVRPSPAAQGRMRGGAWTSTEQRSIDSPSAPRSPLSLSSRSTAGLS